MSRQNRAQYKVASGDISQVVRLLDIDARLEDEVDNTFLQNIIRGLAFR